ncbi:MAG TPA: electron transfer flavoprotein subunit alpha/FixB family protein [Thermoanaerobaculia bacterium]
MPGVLVVCESKDGKLKKASREALSAGRKLAGEGAGDLAAFLVDAGTASEAGRYGAKKAYVAALGDYTTEKYTAAVEQVIKDLQPSVVLLAGTSNGRDLAPRVAARAGAGVASDVDRLEWKDGKLTARRPVYAGRAFATVEVQSTPAIATTRPNAFPAEESGDGAAETSDVSAAADDRVKLIESKTPEAGELSVAEADIIVSGGRGLKEAANFSYIKDLAHAIGGAVGASRATVDAGWIDHQHQVGQTGRVVSPNLYIAAGISGAIQHLAGMSSSKHIVAINKDPEAPIFRIADLGIVGDLFQILPVLTEEVKKAKAH